MEEAKILTAERKLVLADRVTRLTEIRNSINKLVTALSNLAMCEQPRQLTNLTGALRYVKTLASSELPSGMRTELRKIQNELVSLREGVFTDSVKPSDLTLVAAVTALAELDRRIKAANDELATEEIQPLDASEEMILRNQTYKEKLPAIGDKEFVVGRVPLTFGTTPSRNQTGVSFMNLALLERQGFKAESLDGYTVLHNQLVIGIGHKALEGAPIIQKTLKKFDDEGRRIEKVLKRATSAYDIAEQIVALVELKTGNKWVLVTDKSYRYNGAVWFWAMRDKDAARLGKALHSLNIPRWGFAF